MNRFHSYDHPLSVYALPPQLPSLSVVLEFSLVSAHALGHPLPLDSLKNDLGPRNSKATPRKSLLRPRGEILEGQRMAPGVWNIRCLAWRGHCHAQGAQDPPPHAPPKRLFRLPGIRSGRGTKPCSLVQVRNAAELTSSASLRLSLQ